MFLDPKLAFTQLYNACVFLSSSVLELHELAP